MKRWIWGGGIAVTLAVGIWFFCFYSSSQKDDYEKPGTIIAVIVSMVLLMLPIIAFEMVRRQRPKPEVKVRNSDDTAVSSNVPSSSEPEKEKKKISEMIESFSVGMWLLSSILIAGSTLLLFVFGHYVSIGPSIGFVIPLWCWTLLIIPVVLFFSKKTWARVIASVLTGIIIGVMIFHSGKLQNTANESEQAQVQPDSSKRSPTGRGKHPVGHIHTVDTEDPVTAKRTREKLKDHPDLIAKLIQESDLNHCTPGTKVCDKAHIYRSLAGKGHAIGVGQIREDKHQEDCRGLDLYDLDGNLDCALALYNKYGLEPWLVDPDSRLPLDYDLVVDKKDTWTEIKLPLGMKCTFNFDKEVEQMRDKNPPPETNKPDIEDHYGKTQIIAFKMKDEPAKSHFHYDFP